MTKEEKKHERARQAMLQRIIDMEPGESVVYFHGFHLAEAADGNPQLSGTREGAWDAHIRQLACLTQKRRGNKFDYIATRASYDYGGEA